MPKRIATWNPTRGIWEDPHGAMDLLSEHSEPFSATWPTSGTTRNGSAYERPTPVLRTAGSASSSSHVLLKTPTSNLGENGGPQHPDFRKEGGHGPTLADEVAFLLPTPTAEIATKSTRALTRSTENGRRTGGGQSSPLGLDETASLLNGVRPPHLPPHEDLPPASRAIVSALLPTPSAMMANDAEHPDDWWERWKYHANRTDQRPTQAGMPLAISAKLLARGDHSRLRFAAGSPSSDD